MAEEDEASSEDKLMEWETARALLQEEIDTDEQFKLAVDGDLSSDDDVKKESNWKSVPNKPEILLLHILNLWLIISITECKACTNISN